MNKFAKFLDYNGLKRKEIASFLGVSGAFITQITSGDRNLPLDKLAILLNNPFGWNTSMLTSQEEDMSVVGGVYQKPYDEKYEQIMDIIRKMQTDAQSSKRDDGYIRRLLEELAEVKAERDTLRDENAVLKYQLKNKGENAAEAADHSSSASAV